MHSSQQYSGVPHVENDHGRIMGTAVLADDHRRSWSPFHWSRKKVPEPEPEQQYSLPLFDFPPLMESHDGHYWCRLCHPGLSYHHNNNDPDCQYDETCTCNSRAASFDSDSRPLHQPKEVDSTDEEDPNLVTWDGPNDPKNPMNWSNGKKWAATLMVSSFTFISPVSSTMVAPALDVIADEFKIKNDIEKVLVMSIFLLAYAIGPFVIGPLSEIYGRVVVLQSANMVYLVFNTACGFAQTREQMLAFRFLSGLGGSAPQALGGGVLSDCWSKEERGKSVAIYSLAPFLGPAVGPMAGGFITQYSTWRWIFWSTSLLDLAVQIIATLFLQETYAPKILHVKAKKLRAQTGNPDLRTKWETPERSFGQILRKNLVRPFIMLGTQPAIQVMALYRAYLYGLMYLAFATFPTIWREQYNMSVSMASLNYASLGVGFVIGIQIVGPLNDRLYAHLKTRYSSPGIPEFRIPLMAPGGLLIPIGLLIYGWAAHFHTHPIGPNIGAALFACGLLIAFQCAQAYVVDAYTTYAASASGAVAFLRTLAGFGFPLFAGRMFETLGVGGGNSVLAGVAAVLGVLAPWGLWVYGQELRRRSTYCSG